MTTPTFRFFRESDLAALPPVRWLLTGLLPAGGGGMIYGPSGTYKTFVAIAIACSVATGTPCFGLTPGLLGTVVYVGLEGLSGFHARLQAWKLAHYVEAIPDLIVVPDPVFLHDGPSVAAFVAQLRAVGAGQLVLLIVDTLSRCSAGSDENINADRELTNEGLAYLRRELGCATLVVHHTGINETRERGGTALRAALDSVLAMKQGDSGLELVVEKQRDAESGLKLPIHMAPFGDSLVALDGVGDQHGRRRNPKAVALLQVLDAISLSDGVGCSVWLQASGLTPATFYRLRKELVREPPLVDVVSRGRYVVNPAGHDLLLSLSPNSHGATTRAGPLLPLTLTSLRSGSERERVVPLGESRGDAWESESAARTW